MENNKRRLEAAGFDYEAGVANVSSEAEYVKMVDELCDRISYYYDLIGDYVDEWDVEKTTEIVTSIKDISSMLAHEGLVESSFTYISYLTNDNVTQEELDAQTENFLNYCRTLVRSYKKDDM